MSKQETWYVNEYLRDKSYGGPEEGGWWFDTGAFIKCHGEFKTRTAAYKKYKELQDYIEEKQEGHYPPGSVLCNGWPDLLIEDEEGESYPQRRPHYE